ncbi:hypothetical protein F5I97DRAFT_1845327 [Phlebopus sp. FC_14]|nr:hypothetical protein F5I97DRAFT_1845327 [Phlebopus sp. FC_14]
MARGQSPHVRKTIPGARSSVSRSSRSPLLLRNHMLARRQTRTTRFPFHNAQRSDQSDRFPRDNWFYEDDGDVDQLDERKILSDDDNADWDEDSTLIALLEDHDEPESQNKTSVVDRLGPAFTAQRLELKEYTRQILIPVVQHTKHIHDIVEEDINVRLLQGMTLFDKSSRRLEDSARCECDKVRAVYGETKKSLEILLSEYGDLAKESDILFQDFKAALDRHVYSLRQCVGQVAGDVERLISKLDKKAKHLGAEDHAKAKEKLLRGILEKY